jgi:rubrerythrin
MACLAIYAKFKKSEFLGMSLYEGGEAGFVYEGHQPPESCPACHHPRSYYEPLADNYL